MFACDGALRAIKRKIGPAVRTRVTACSCDTCILLFECHGLRSAWRGAPRARAYAILIEAQQHGRGRPAVPALPFEAPGQTWDRVGHNVARNEPDGRRQAIRPSGHIAGARSILRGCRIQVISMP